MLDNLLSRSIKETLAISAPNIYGTVNSIRKKSLKITFSQCGEDLAISKYLPEDNGMYLDVGGGHPVIGSNTLSLDKRNYKGFVVEPISKFSESFKKRKNLVRVFETVCAPTNEPVDFFEFENSFLSTTSIEVANKLISSGEKLISKKKLTPKRLSDLGVSASPSCASVLDVDVEGVDLEVLNSNDWGTFRPRVILIESRAQNKQRIEKYLKDLNYSLVEICEMTLIFVSNEYLIKQN